MNPYIMTTGSRGLHVVAPLRPEAGFDEVRALAMDMAALLASRHKDELTTEQRKSRRRGRVYLDVLRNAYGQTTVLPYSVRPLPGAPVATPLALSELGEHSLNPQRWHLKNIARRLGQRDDPWARIERHATAPVTARSALDEMEIDAAP